jgi:hypothetical protein
MRVQALRQKQTAIAANQDAWTQHVAERSMLGVSDPGPVPHHAAWPEPAPAPDVDESTKEPVSEDEMNSQDAAFETWLSTQLKSPTGGQPDGSRLQKIVREAMAQQRPASQAAPANGRESAAVRG